MKVTEAPNNEAAILARVLQADQDALSLAAAKALLKLGFTQDDRERMHELAVKNQEAGLTAAEQRELDSYCRVGRFLDLLGARVRRSLAKHGRRA
jgi:hypothetical protein